MASVTPKICDEQYEKARKAFKAAESNVLKAVYACTLEATRNLISVGGEFSGPDIANLIKELKAGIEHTDITIIGHALREFVRDNPMPRDLESPQASFILAAVSLQEAIGNRDLDEAYHDTVRSRASSNNLKRLKR
jgi:hypothetical protein